MRQKDGACEQYHSNLYVYEISVQVQIVNKTLNRQKTDKTTSYKTGIIIKTDKTRYKIQVCLSYLVHPVRKKTINRYVNSPAPDGTT